MAAVLVVSDRCHAKQMEDRAGPCILKFLEDIGIQCLVQEVVPDEQIIIEEKLRSWCDGQKVSLILTSGGTGFSHRDVTPEATKNVIEKEAPGMAVVMLMGSLNVTSLAMLSRAVCGIRGRTLIVNLPGSPKAVTECLQFVKPALNHALQLLADETAEVSSTHEQLQAEGPVVGIFKPVVRGCGHHHSHSSKEVDPSLVARRHRESPYPMIEVGQAQEIVLENCETLGKQSIPLLDSVGQVLAEDIFAGIPLPPFPASMKDGYAVIAEDGTGRRRLLNDASVCGSNPELQEVRPGFCMRINTGAPLPKGADAIVMVEYTKVLDSTPDGQQELEIEILKPPAVGIDIRPVGSDIEQGQMLLQNGAVIGASEVGLLAAVGRREILVSRAPVVAVMSTGTELQNVSEELTEGRIYDSNRPMLLSLLKSHGVTARDAGIARDDLDSLTKSISEALSSADILVTTGGVSMGEKDLLRYVLTTKFGAVVHFARVNMKPGKPTTFATCKLNGQTKLIFGLPGNPVSAMVTSHLYVIPACRKISGFRSTSVLPTKLKVKLGGDHALSLDPRPEYHRAVLSWEPNSPYPVARSTGNQLSSRLLSMHSANALVILPGATKDQGEVAPGTTLDALIIDTL